MTYRRRNSADTWHFCRNRTLWPTSDHKEQQSKPTTGELCNQCRSKDSAGTCTR